ncbi:fatty acid desaturase [Pseudomonas putida]|uniref:fatty acid desaturase n=1 Tax=Pseudomonas putida TaxID=303 RepID=UPI0008193877|nr:fatty acid desaturase [Pseudomonas putida]OCT24245.1 fatty acid desaturase [Pseudomonas putida]OCT27325.1 fatty acid desaturase [Pseudomonas putida]OCT28608.1 fatty acid desaturase [Pseudomonas putida]OCT38159.1 fatty acid desaturase [Pseudomonas putida]
MPHYLDDAQREDVQHLQRTFTGRTEWPTWLVLAVVYGGWTALLPLSHALGVWPTTLLLIPLLVLWLSLQHELLHGHPTRFPWLNKLLGYAPFALWYPYTLYRDSHLIHHRDHDLTLPGLDPESRYLTDRHWQRSTRWHRGVLWLGKTLPGRVLVGAPLGLFGLAREELARLGRGDRQAWLMWLTHGLCSVLLLVLIARFSALSVLHYVFLVSVPAVGLAMLRSFYEHRPHPLPEQRTVINEAGRLWSLLFLNNNLHLVHHDLPGLPWYFIPRVYQRHRAQWLVRSGHFLVPGYGALLRRHGLAPIDSPRHPFA